METNFKVDVPSFALGFNTGKKKGGDKTVIDVPELPIENIEEGKIYRVTIAGEPVTEIWHSIPPDIIEAFGGTLHPLTKNEDFIKTLMGADATYELHVVDELPAVPELSVFGQSFHIYAVNDTSSEAFLFIEGAGWVPGSAADFGEYMGTVSNKDDIQEPVEGGTFGYYILKKAGQPSTTYGIPDEADNKTLYEHNGSEWVECKAGGAELNIAYGDTPPEDTTKMWCKTSQADGVDILPVDRFDSLPALSKSIVIGATVVVDNKIYIVSPGTSNSGLGDGQIWCYDTETKELLPDTFKTRSRGGHSAWYCNGKLYSFGGNTENTYYGNTVTMTKLSDGTRSELSLSFDGYTYGMAMGIMGEKVYLLGGCKNYESSSGSTRIACFDCGTDTIAPIEAVLPAGRTGAGYVTHGDQIYVIGGATSNYIGQTTIYRFDMVTHEVAIMAYLPKKLYKPVCALFGDEIYIMYGTEKINASASEVANDSIYVYNILENTVKEFPQKSAEDMYRPPLCAHADQFYLIGGGKGTLMNATDQVNTFRPYPVSRPDCLAVETADAGVPFTVFSGQNNVRCPVSGVFKGNIDGTADPVETAIYNGDEWETI